jgi:hypothetical protein
MGKLTDIIEYKFVTTCFLSNDSTHVKHFLTTLCDNCHERICPANAIPGNTMAARYPANSALAVHKTTARALPYERKRPRSLSRRTGTPWTAGSVPADRRRLKLPTRISLESTRLQKVIARDDAERYRPTIESVPDR